ncbi:MAG: hypothetical protein WDO73_32655 [Ignavibacteriota bacterium]
MLHKLSPGDPLHDGVSEIAVAGKRAAALTAQLLCSAGNRWSSRRR